MSAPEKLPPSSLRIDKWLWAARFYKTRSLATEAIHSGHVKLNGTGVKPARELRIGDTLDITAGDTLWSIEVCGLNDQRRPASEAQLLYAETAESATHRNAAKEFKRLAPTPGSDLHGRPSKKARRQIRRFNEGL